MVPKTEQTGCAPVEIVTFFGRLACPDWCKPAFGVLGFGVLALGVASLEGTPLGVGGFVDFIEKVEALPVDPNEISAGRLMAGGVAGAIAAGAFEPRPDEPTTSVVIPPSSSP